MSSIQIWYNYATQVKISQVFSWQFLFFVIFMQIGVLSVFSLVKTVILIELSPVFSTQNPRKSQGYS